MSKPLICILGRSGSGKNYIANKLERRGFASVKSYTTRPMRHDDPNDINTHTFISPDRVSEYKDDIVADTYFNGAYYFATRQQLNEADIYILDKAGLVQLYRNYHDRDILAFYIDCDSSICAERMSQRGDSDEAIMSRHLSITERGAIMIKAIITIAAITMNCIMAYACCKIAGESGNEH